MSPEQEEIRRRWFSMDRRVRRETDRPVLIHGRQSDATTDPPYLYTLQSYKMRDPATDEMYFVLGYSQLGGPDVMRP
jgi:hypothetical protein